MSAPRKIGILAGAGPLPGRVVEACSEAGRDVFVIAFNDETDPALVAGVPHAWADVTAVGRIIRLLREADVDDVVLIGPVRLPDFRRLRPDWHSARLLPKILKAARHGDDAMLTVVIDHLEEQGFAVIGADAVLASLAAPPGVLGRHRPTDADMADIRRGADVVAALGRLDIGQAAVVRAGYVLAVEAAEGTDAMLDRCVGFRGAEPAGVLVKLPKPDQERRADLPTIGVVTVEKVVAAGLRGIAIEAGGALIDDLKRAIEVADANGIFLIGLAPEDGH